MAKALLLVMVVGAALMQTYPIRPAHIQHNRPATPLAVQGVVAHDTENNEATAQANRDYFNRAGVDASAHLIVDWNEIIECIPWERGEAEQAWHAGPTANSMYVGIELCTTKDPDKFAASFGRYLYAIARVLDEYGLKTGPGLWSHKGVAEKWHETNHTDPYGYLQRHGKTWQDVLDGVNVYLDYFGRQNGSTPILGPPSATVEQAKAWARSRGATEQFISLAPLYWQIAPEYAVDPAPAYGQSGKESNFGHFTGIVQAWMHNPCGLKTHDADGDDITDHASFPDWQTGVKAHIQHLALYADSGMLMGANIVDPRHFPSIRGVAPTVEALGGHYAPSQDYGKSIVRDYLQPLLATPEPAPPTQDWRALYEIEHAARAAAEGKLAKIAEIVSPGL